jgi:hypothetical protein
MTAAVLIVVSEKNFDKFSVKNYDKGWIFFAF